MNYLWTLLAIGGSTVVNLLIAPWFGYQVVGLTALFVVFLIAIFLGRGPALLAAAISALLWNFLFIPPHYTFCHFCARRYPALSVLIFLIALITGNLTARTRLQEQQARYNADRNLALYTLAHDIGSALTMDDILRTAVNQIGHMFAAEVAILLRTASGNLAPAHPASTLPLDEKEFAVASWVCLHGRPAGRFTDSLPSATARYLPLLASGKTVGVLGIRTRNQARLSADQEALLETFANQTALVMQRELLDEATAQAVMLRESERLYTALLNSISHELRTPIATITGAASSLLDPQTQANRPARSELTRDIQQAAERLNRLVANLLDMSRLDAGRGLWLRGDGRGGFAAVPGQESGLNVYGEQRGAAAADAR
ncbi:MAG: DUF4118 domain-containing protein [Nitrospiraceae bacterium]|nr:DUF4118 domain-containing protein [Nitrospiraceae bacterium]